MAKIAQLFLAAVVLTALVNVCTAADKFQCYVCDNCKDYSDDKLVDCPSKKCFIEGNPEEENWKRGCQSAATPACPNGEKNEATEACSTCTTDECNSGSYVTASITMAVGLAALIKMLH